MGFFDAIWHLFNLFGPAVGMALCLPVLVKLLWWRRTPWALVGLLVRRVGGTGALIVLAFWLVSGRDGTIAMYATLVVAAALTVWWAAFKGRA